MILHSILVELLCAVYGRGGKWRGWEFYTHGDEDVQQWMLHGALAIMIIEVYVLQADGWTDCDTGHCSGVKLTENSSRSIITGKTGLAHS